MSATIHRSFDGSKVVNYAQWESKQAFEDMQKDPGAVPHLEASAALAKFDPVLCEVIETFGV